MLLLADTVTTRRREAKHVKALLMQRAAESIWRCVLDRWPNAMHIVVVAGNGNNGEDGRLFATLATASGRKISMIEPKSIPSGEVVLPEADLIIDALLGIGLKGRPRSDVLRLIEAINVHPAPVLSIDVPSGIEADTGNVTGTAVLADVTLQFLDRHLGLYTGEAMDFRGRLLFDGLIDPDPGIPTCWLVDIEDALEVLPERKPNSHKGMFGHVCIIAGNHGMAGAGFISSKAALRSGAGKVTWGTRQAYAQEAWLACPELMTVNLDSEAGLEQLLAHAEVLAIGPGLAQDAWSTALIEAVLAVELPTVFDADALNFLAVSKRRLHSGCVVTPHPLEAARMLDSALSEVQRDRFAAAREISMRFNAVCVLKGAGSVVCAPDGDMRVIDGGNSGMAVAGMGDALTGIVAAMLAQTKDAFNAAWIGACVHAAAGDRVECEQGARGMLASDLIDQLPHVMKG